MNLSLPEERFLQAWMRDEFHFRQGPGPAKRLEREHQIMPADLAALIAAWLPDPHEQSRRAEQASPEERVEWPWQSREEFETRLHQAREELARRGRNHG